MEASGDRPGGEQDGDTEVNLGVKLRNARESQDLTLDDVAAELRIRADALQALEENRFEAIGPAVFAKGYLKQYAGRLGLDVDAIVADYERAVGSGPVEVAPSKTIKLHDERQITVWVVAALVLVVLVGGLSIWLLRQPGQFWGPPAVSTGAPAPAIPEAPPEALDAAETVAAGAESSTLTDEEPVVSSEAVVSSDPAASSEPAPSSERAPSFESELASEIELPSESELSGEAARDLESVTEIAAAAAIADTAETADAAEAANAVIDGPAVEVVFVEDSWAEITSASGENLFYRLGQAGTRARFEAREGLAFFFGNASGVELRLEGETVAIPPSSRRGDLAQFELGDLAGE